ncbi:hypothetical protein LguiB_034382 [Lonicera macranthoides]
MDSRESPAPPHHLHHHHSQQPPPQQHQHQQGIMMHNPYAPTTNNNTTTNTSPMISPPNSSIQNTRFPFNSITSQHQYAGGGDGSSSGLGTGGGFTIEAARKKRGRPRKYSPDANNNSNIALGLSTTSPTVGHISTSTVGPHGDSGSGAAGGAAHSSDPSSSKKGRGRPAGSGKKQLDALGAPGVGFTPHVIIANAGEDIASKILAFSQQGPRSVCILSANGAVSNVTLSQPAMSASSVKYEGRFEIISLTGSFSPSESNGNRNRSLTISLAGSDGHVLGGGVAGVLIAATPVQVIVGSFIADGKKSKSGRVSSPPATNMLNFGGAPVTGNSPPSEGEPSGESSEESDSSAFNRGPEHYNNANQPSIQSMPMYTNMGWPNSTMNMLPN